MFEKFRKYLILVFPVTLMLIYLCCACFFAFGANDIKEIVVNSLAIVLLYWAWWSFRKETLPVVITILLMGIAVILPFIDGVYRPEDWLDWAEKLFGFAMILWPVPVICLSHFCMGKFFGNNKIVLAIGIAIVFFLAFGFHFFAEGIMEESWSDDLGVPVMWLAEGIIWSAALYFADRGKRKRTYILMAWLACLVIFYGATFMETSYLSSRHTWDWVRGRYWNRILFFCWPMFLIFLLRILCTHITKDKPYFAQKVSILYFSVALLLSWLLTDLSLNFGVAAFRDDICDWAYLLILAEAVVWGEVYRKTEYKKNRIRALLFLILVNIGVFVFLLVRNERLQEVLYYMGFSFMGCIPSPKADWTGYRKAAVSAFFSNDLNVLDNVYKNEGYYRVLNGSHGLASLRFHFGFGPLLAMIVLLVITVMALWNWKRDSERYHVYARYFAIGYLLKMTMAVILQMNLVLSPYSEFPFTGYDIPELVVLILLIHKSHIRPYRKGRVKAYAQGKGIKGSSRQNSGRTVRRGGG